MKLSQVGLAVISTLLVLLGCTSVPDDPTLVKNALDEAIAENNVSKEVKPLRQIPNSVQQELMQQGMHSSQNSASGEKRLEIAATDVEAKDFFTALVQGSKYSIAVHPNVKGSITLSLSDVTLVEALEVIEDMYGYQIRRNKQVIQIFPSGLRTETIALNYLFIKRFGMSNTNINAGGVSENDPNNGGGNNSSNGSNGSNSSNNRNSNNSNGNGNGSSSNQPSSGVNISTSNEADLWHDLKETLKELVGNEPGRNIFVSPQAGLITIKAMPEEINAVKSFVNDIETQMHRQVIIEAKIMEVTLQDDYQQGVNWQEVLTSAGSVDLGFQSSGNIVGDVISNTIGGTTSLSFTGSDFSGVIELLQTQGNVQILSSPRITATNNQKAVIKVGEDEYYVTEVSSTTIANNTTSVTPEIQLTPFFSGIALDVTPQIDDEGDVILHVHPSVTLTKEQTKTIKLGEQTIVLPLAKSNVRESDTVIKASSGEIVVIGGLIESRKVDTESKVPLLGDIPYLGELFKSKTQTLRKTELVIMLKPIVTGKDAWQSQLQDARAILKEWFPEEDDEGNEGEKSEQKDGAESQKADGELVSETAA